MHNRLLARPQTSFISLSRSPIPLPVACHGHSSSGTCRCDSHFTIQGARLKTDVWMAIRHTSRHSVRAGNVGEMNGSLASHLSRRSPRAVSLLGLICTELARPPNPLLLPELDWDLEDTGSLDAHHGGWPRCGRLVMPQYPDTFPFPASDRHPGVKIVAEHDGLTLSRTPDLRGVVQNMSEVRVQFEWRSSHGFAPEFAIDSDRVGFAVLRSTTDSLYRCLSIHVGGCLFGPPQ
jgi:hypothetical protein